MMMQLVVAGLVRDFDIEVSTSDTEGALVIELDIEAPPGTDEQSTEVRAKFVSRPVPILCNIQQRSSQCADDTFDRQFSLRGWSVRCASAFFSGEYRADCTLQLIFHPRSSTEQACEMRT